MNRNGLAMWYALLAGLFVAVATIIVSSVLDKQEHEHIHRITAATALSVETLIQQDLKQRIVTLARLAERWDISRGTPKIEWESDAISILSSQPGYQAIEWADASLIIRWVVPFEGNEMVANLDLQSNLVTTEIAQNCRDLGKPVFSSPSQLAQGRTGIVAFIPVQKDEQFDGLMLGVLIIDDWLDNLLQNIQSTEHHLTVSINEQEVYNQVADATALSDEWLQQRQFSLYGLDVLVQATPRADFLTLVHSHVSTVLFIAGLLLSLLTVIAVYWIMTAQGRLLQFKVVVKKLELLLKNIPGMAYRGKNQYPWEVEFVSEGCSKITGYSSRELEENKVTWGDLIHPDDREFVKKSIKLSLSANESFELEYRIQARDGTERWVSERGRALEGADNLIDGIINDVTERKTFESKLELERDYTSAIITSAFEAVITFDSAGKIETFNPAAERIFGYSQNEIEHYNFDLLVPSFDLTLHRAKEQNGIGDIHGKRNDGSIFPIQLSVSEMLYDSDTRFICVLRDLSEQRAAELEAHMHRENLAHVDRLDIMGEMATGIAHEINQPLASISLFSETGKRLLALGKYEKLPYILDNLIQHAKRAGDIMLHMQNMVRQHDSIRDIMSCDVLIKEGVSLFEIDARVKNIVINLDLADNLPAVHVGIIQIQQVLLNLLRNAMEAIQLVDFEQGNIVTLKARLGEENTVKISVSDCGPGVSEIAQRNIFTPFSTTKKDGMGIGLSISHSIISAHGGQMTFFNNDTGGATFWFTLPVVKQGEYFA